MLKCTFRLINLLFCFLFFFFVGEAFGDRSEKLFRIGFEYLYGSDPQYEFTFYNQNRAGIGMWYDY